MINDHCNWDNPGVNPYTGNISEAVSKYTEIPAASRAQIIKAIETKKYDDIVLITKNKVIGTHTYSPNITNMHFGKGTVCKEISRKGWANSRLERAYVYSHGTYSVIIPEICGNVSLIVKEKHNYGEWGSQTVHQVPEPWVFPAILACAAFMTFKRK